MNTFKNKVVVVTGGGVVSGGGGGAVFATTGAAARACARPLIVPEPGYVWPFFLATGGTSECLLLTIGTGRPAVAPATGRRTRCCATRRRCVPALAATARVGEEGAEGADAGAWTTPGAESLGI